GGRQRRAPEHGHRAWPARMVAGGPDPFRAGDAQPGAGERIALRRPPTADGDRRDPPSLRLPAPRPPQRTTARVSERLRGRPALSLSHPGLERNNGPKGPLSYR